MDSTITEKRSGIDHQSEVPKSTHYMFWGAVIGLVAGLVTMFSASTAYAAMNGYDAVNCVAVGSIMTLMLSQPTALAGVVFGTACGGICALVAHCVHYTRSAN